MDQLTPTHLRKALYAILDAIATLERDDVLVPTKRGMVRITADTSVSAMAKGRGDFIDSLVDRMKGGFREFYKYRLMEREKSIKSTHRHLAEHWKTEASRILVFELSDDLTAKLKFNEKGRSKAAQKAVEDFLKEHESTRRTQAINALEMVIGKKPDGLISDEDTRLALDLVALAFSQSNLEPWTRAAKAPE
jgi:hypothetical protein